LAPGDEIIVPAFTWISSAYVALHLGLKPIFCDIRLDTFNLDPEALNACIGPRTRAIMPVHLFGMPAQMDQIMALAEAHDLRVVEDAACGLGAYFRGQHVGRFGEMGAFSFHPRKAISTGEGGMIISQSPQREARLRSLRDHGASISDRARHEGKAAFLLSEFKLLGFNYRMTDLQGALGETQMLKLPEIQRRRAALAVRYDRLLADLEWLQRPQVPEEMIHGWQSYVCLFRPEEPRLERMSALFERRNAMMMKMETQGVSTRQGTHAVHALDLFQERLGHHPEEFPRAWMAEHLSLTLPLFPGMSEVEQDYVVEQLRACFR